MGRGQGLASGKRLLGNGKVKFEPFRFKTQINKCQPKSHSRALGMMLTVTESALAAGSLSCTASWISALEGFADHKTDRMG